MLDSLKNLGNLPGLMARAKEMQAQMQAMQEELGRKQFTADSGAGVVSATVTGKLELKKIHIDKARVDVADTELLEDLIVAAVSAAQAKAAAAIAEDMQKAAVGMGLPPGMLPG
ncbi:MAG TPA: YbaB/EbfC family nucleoid-associated protein [Tepidisphaeraceae bacterium]|jgi:hypothetical protein